MKTNKLFLALAIIMLVASVMACGTTVPQTTALPTLVVIQPTYTPYPTQVPPTPYPTQVPPTPMPTQEPPTLVPTAVPTIAPIKLSECGVQSRIGGAMVYLGATGPMAQQACDMFYNNVISDPTFQGITITRVPYLPDATIYCEASPDNGVSMLYMMADSVAAGIQICAGAGWPLIYSDGG